MLNYILGNASSTKVDFDTSERVALLSLVDFSIVLFGLTQYYRYAVDAPITKENIWFAVQGVIYALVLFYSVFNILNGYNFNYASLTRRILPITSFVAVFYSLVFVFTPFITPIIPDSRLVIVMFVVYNIVVLSGWRVLYAYFIHRSAFHKRVVVITSGDWTNEEMQIIRDSIQGENFSNGYEIQKVYNLKDPEIENRMFSDFLNKAIRQGKIKHIVSISRDHSDFSKHLNSSFVSAIEQGVKVETFLALYEEVNEALPIKYAGDLFYFIFPIARNNSNYFYKIYRIGLDTFSGLLGATIMGLVIPFVYVMNLFSNKGPLFYSQYRVGQGGKEYKIIKFRSMVTDAEKNGAVMASKGDARITKFGAFLRKTRIDELPQFINVLKGEMSLIGPRPERKVFVDQLAEQIPFYNARHLVRPGITGWAQVKYPYGENLEDSYNKLEYDLYYIKKRSITLDLRVVLKTINSVLFKKGQ